MAPPFVVKNEDGSYGGISIDLWREIASRLGIKYKLVPRDLHDLIQGVHNGSLDMSIGALTVTAQREDLVDFSYPFYTTGLAIAVAHHAGSPWLTTVKRVFSGPFLSILGTLVIVLLLVGFAVWIFERRRNPDMFGGPAWKGIGHSFWWAAVTMTTVGYGDKAPITLPGRIIGLIWMFAAIILISGFTAAIATSLTVHSLQSPIKGPAGLSSVDVGTVQDSSSAGYLEQHHISFNRFSDVDAALQALSQGKVQAVVYDAPLLQYKASNSYKGKIDVLPNTFRRQSYAFVLPNGSPLREPINRAMLRELSSPQWQDILYRYLGSNAPE